MSTRSEPMDGWRLATLVLGVLTTAVGAWAALASAHFFATVAAATGPFNAHLMRDVGAAYLTAGAALVWAALGDRAARAPLVTVAAIFLSLHAAVHVFEISAGALPTHHWLEDLPGVFAPAVAVAALAWVFHRRARGGPAGS